jgi:hypothetical protein
LIAAKSRRVRPCASSRCRKCGTVVIGFILAGQIDADEVPDRLAVVDRVFDPLVRQCEALLHDIEPQHPLEPDWRPPVLAALGIVGLDRGHKARPGNEHVDLFEKPLALRLLLLGGELEIVAAPTRKRINDRSLR